MKPLLVNKEIAANTISNDVIEYINVHSTAIGCFQLGTCSRLAHDGGGAVGPIWNAHRHDDYELYAWRGMYDVILYHLMHY